MKALFLTVGTKFQPGYTLAAYNIYNGLADHSPGSIELGCTSSTSYISQSSLDCFWKDHLRCCYSGIRSTVAGVSVSFRLTETIVHRIRTDMRFPWTDKTAVRAATVMLTSGTYDRSLVLSNKPPNFGGYGVSVMENVGSGVRVLKTMVNTDNSTWKYKSTLLQIEQRFLQAAEMETLKNLKIFEQVNHFWFLENGTREFLENSKFENSDLWTDRAFFGPIGLVNPL